MALARSGRRRRIAQIAALGVVVAAVIFAECGYYFPLTPLSLDLFGKTRLPEAGERARLLFVGDILLADAARRSIALHGYDHIFAATAPLVRSADLAVGNLEGPIALGGRPLHKRWSYQMLPGTAAALSRAGFDLVSLANNHIQDRGNSGLVETRSWLLSAGVTPFGGGSRPAEAHRAAHRKVRGLDVALLGYVAPEQLLGGRRAKMTHLAARIGRAGAAWGDPVLIARDIRAAKARGADIVIVNLHLGDRYQQRPTDFERALCHRIIDAGADAVIGHGPHIAGPIEVYHGRPIAYSVGNFAFGSGNVFARFSLMAFLDVDLRQKRIVALSALPIYTVNHNPWVNFQSKVLVGRQARRVLGELVERSRSLGSAGHLALRSDPWRLLVEF